MGDFLFQHWRDGVEILILTALAYHGFLFLRATRGARILVGLVVLMLSLTVISKLLELEVIAWLLQRLSAFLAIGLVTIFHPELRRLLAELGSQRLFQFSSTDNESLSVLIESMVELSHKRVGALIAVKRNIDMRQFAESGVQLDARITRELLATLFHPKTPLHDGGVIIDEGRIHAAGCVFPVSQKEVRNRSIGLRHRAALGITEETDCVALIVSEESGALSIAFGGKLLHDLDEEELKAKLQQIITRGTTNDEEEDEEKPTRDPGANL
jgi:diadenylate cyclase